MYIKVIEKGCPICRGEVSGNRSIKYLCKKCNVLFKFNELSNKSIKKVITSNKKLNWLEK